MDIAEEYKLLKKEFEKARQATLTFPISPLIRRTFREKQDDLEYFEEVYADELEKAVFNINKNKG